MNVALTAAFVGGLVLGWVLHTVTQPRRVAKREPVDIGIARSA